jgi:hypothetical protein
MPLVDAIRALRDRALTDLNAAHDYYIDSKSAWHIVRNDINAGRAFQIQNLATGSVTTQTDLLRKALGYMKEQLAEATFQQFMAIFESFFFDLLRLWLLAYPQSLFGKKVDFKTVLEAPDKDAITLLVVDKELNELLYDRPTGWFAYLEDRVKLGCPTPDEIGRIAEAKASRDVLIHNRGVTNKTYEAKAGKFARFQDRQRIDISMQYHREIWELVRKIITDMTNAAIAKVP